MIPSSKLYLHSKPVSYRLPFILANIIDASPNNSKKFKFEISEEIWGDAINTRIFPPDYCIKVPMGLNQVLHIVMVCKNLIHGFDQLRYTTRTNPKIWMEYMWTCRVCTYFMRFLDDCLNHELQPQLQ